VAEDRRFSVLCPSFKTVVGGLTRWRRGVHIR
jgi:hypothetical protein